MNQKQEDEEAFVQKTVGQILLFGVVPQCKRSGIGTLIFKKAVHLVEQQYPECALIYFQRNESFVSKDWNSVNQFFLKNHFKLLNEKGAAAAPVVRSRFSYFNRGALSLRQSMYNRLYRRRRPAQATAGAGPNKPAMQAAQPVTKAAPVPPPVQSKAGNQNQAQNTITDSTIFYFNLISLVKKNKKATRNLLREFFKVICRNPFDRCNKEGQKRLKQELKRIKQKYENQDMDEEYKTEPDLAIPEAQQSVLHHHDRIQQLFAINEEDEGANETDKNEQHQVVSPIQNRFGELSRSCDKDKLE